VEDVQAAHFAGPTGVVTDAAGNLFVADSGHHCIRRISADLQAVTVLAGACGSAGFADGAAGTAQFSWPVGLAWAPSGLLLVADSGNARVRAIQPASGDTSTYAGSGESADRDGPGIGCMTGPGCGAFTRPMALAAAPDGSVYVGSGSGRLRRVGADAAREVTSIVTGGTGFQDGAGNAARLLAPMGLAWDGSGVLFTDPGNRRIRRAIPGASAATTVVSTIAGTGNSGSADGPVQSATLALPLSVVSADGRTYVVDAAAPAIRVIE
jgi:sugar lactone lactonase YvrE